MKNIYVGNLVYSATSEQVKELFSQFGKVFNVKLIYDRETKKPKGFGFVEMQEESVSEAIAKLDNTDFMGRTIRVTEANPKKSDYKDHDGDYKDHDIDYKDDDDK